MLSWDSAQTTQAAQTVSGVAWCAELDFASGVQRVTTSPVSFDSDGHNWRGLGAFAGVSGVSESAGTAAQELTLSLALVDNAMLALVMGNVSSYRGRAARLYLQLLGATWGAVGAPRMRWAGYMSKVQITRQAADPAADSPTTGSIDLICSRAGMARARNAQGLRLTDAQQQLRYPGDTGLRYMRALIDQPTPWLTKAFQRI